MNRIFKIFLFAAIPLLIGYFIHVLYTIQKYGHSMDWETYKQYMWIFKDSIRKDIDTSFSFSNVQKNDVYNNFHYKRDYNIVLWEFKETGILDIADASINQNINLDNIKFDSGDILNMEGSLEIPVKYGCAFNRNINLNLDRYSKIEKTIKGVNYKGFYGTVNKMSLSDAKYDHQIVFNYMYGISPTLFLFYKGSKYFYIIVINYKNNQPFDESILNILNLE
jgi:hypothetical protein